MFLEMFKWDKTMLRVLRCNDNFTSIVYVDEQVGPITEPKRETNMETPSEIHAAPL